MTRKAVILLSGGLDSAVAAYTAKKDVGVKGELYALSVNYGQAHGRELKSALKIGKALEVVRHEVTSCHIPTDSALTDPEIEIRTSGVEDGIPATWVPQRNSILLAMAFAYAESVDADFVYTGFNVIDYSGYPDCRPEFVRAAQKAFNFASKRFVETGREISIVTPLILMTKAKIVEEGFKLGVPFELTWSCYKGGDKACGVCDSCRIRVKAFETIGREDPIEYEEIDSGS